LDLLIDGVPTLRVLVIITFRPEFTAPWVGRPQISLLSLNRLPPLRGAEMIMQVMGGKALPITLTAPCQLCAAPGGAPHETLFSHEASCPDRSSSESLVRCRFFSFVFRRG
jgi:hypothetical protein